MTPILKTSTTPTLKASTAPYNTRFIGDNFYAIPEHLIAIIIEQSFLRGI